MLKNNLKQLSLYTILYDKIPENHMLKSMNSAVDFSFIKECGVDIKEVYGDKAYF